MSSGSKQKSRGWRVWGDIGFVTHYHFVSVSAEMALWGFSRGSMRGCSCYGLAGAAGNGAGPGDVGLATVTAPRILQGLRFQEVHFFIFCTCVGSEFPPLRS